MEDGRVREGRWERDSGRWPGAGVVWVLGELGWEGRVVSVRMMMWVLGELGWEGRVVSVRMMMWVLGELLWEGRVVSVRMMARNSQQLVTTESYHHLLYRVYHRWTVPGKMKQESPNYSEKSPPLLPKLRDGRQRHRPLWLVTWVTLL